MSDDDDDDDYEVIPLPADYDDSEPGASPEVFARPVERPGGLGDVLLPPLPPAK